MHEDKLEIMWMQQENFMQILQQKRNFPEFPLDLSKKENQKFIKDIIRDCKDELFEASYLLKNSKLHRKTEIGEFDDEEFLEECVDAQHFLFEIFILAGIDLERMFKKYIQKGNLNFHRIENGY